MTSNMLGSTSRSKAQLRRSQTTSQVDNLELGADFFKPLPKKKTKSAKAFGSNISTASSDSRETIETKQSHESRKKKSDSAILTIMQHDFPSALYPWGGSNGNGKQPERRTLLRVAVESKPFQIVVYGTICVNTVQMGVAVDYPEMNDVWQIMEFAFTGIFLVEMIMKLVVLQRQYFDDGWNRMDCFLVTLSVIDNWIITPLTQSDQNKMSQLTILRILRICRVVRIARIFKVFKDLWVILKGILDSLRTICWVIVLLLVTLYVCSIMCVDMIGREDLYPGYEDDEDLIEAHKSVALWNNYVYFGTISRSMYTLFNVVILTEFPEFGRAVIEKQPEMAIFFVIFVVFTTFGIINVIIGVVVDNTMVAVKALVEEDDERQKEEKLRLLERIRDMVFDLDTDESGTISRIEMEKGWNIPELQSLLKRMRLPTRFSAQELMYLLDINGDQEISYEEFITNFYRVLLNDTFQINCSLFSGLNEVKAEIKSGEQHRTKLKNEIVQELTSNVRNELQSEIVKDVVSELKGVIKTCIRETLKEEGSRASENLCRVCSSPVGKTPMEKSLNQPSLSGNRISQKNYTTENLLV